LEQQIQTCRENSVTHFELRGVDGKNVLDFDDAMQARIKKRLTESQMGVISIGSPIGKVKITDPFEPHMERFKKAVEMAAFFSAPFIRIFSYYPPEKGADMKPYREEVIRRLKAKVEYIANRNVVLVHENEAEIYGEKGRECLDLMKSINSLKLRSAFDFANFLIAGERPINNWPGLKPYTVHIHVKDAKLDGGKIVPAGEGDGDIPAILKDAYASGYRGFLTLEPHLSVAGQFSGFTGPNLFKVAADALKKVCREINVPLAGA